MPFQLAGQGLIARRLAQSQYSQATLSKSGARLSWKTLSLWQPCFAAGHRGQRRGLRQGTRGTGHGIGGAPTPKQQGQLENFVDYLLECGKRMNLTAVKTRERAFDVLVEDSIALLPVLEDAVNSVVAGGKIRIMDVGSGAGIPGVVLAIMRPEWQLGIHNIVVVRARAEDIGRTTEHREVYDAAVARAVAELRVLVELCLPFVKVGGSLVAAKGADVEDEVAAAENATSVLGGSIEGVHCVESFGSLGQRTAVVIKKMRTTPEKFPRRPGIPNKRPIQRDA